jgi:hypothetical protein
MAFMVFGVCVRPWQLSEDDYNDLVATMELCAVPGMQKKITVGLDTSLDECLPANEVDR